MKVLLSVVLVLGASVLGAAPLEKSVKLSFGDAQLVCKEPGSWRFATSVAREEGVDVVTVTLAAEAVRPIARETAAHAYFIFSLLPYSLQVRQRRKPMLQFLPPPRPTPSRQQAVVAPVECCQDPPRVVQLPT